MATLGTTSTGHRRHLHLVLYQLGRCLSYACAGALLGFLAAGIAGYHQGLLVAVRLTAGLVLIAMGLYVAGWWFGLTRLESLGNGLWRHLAGYAATLVPIGNSRQALAAGVVWGWLPCGLVYSTLVWSASRTTGGRPAS